MPTIGEMQHRITIEQKTRGGSDGMGGFLPETWATLYTSWAKIDPKSGREIVAADQMVHRVSHIITIRSRPGITTAMRVKFNGRNLGILAMREYLEAGRFIELVCEEGAPS